MESIFDILNAKHICHAVCVGNIFLEGAEWYNVKLYFIVVCNIKSYRKYGFYPDQYRDDVLIYGLDQQETQEFKSISNQYNLIINVEEGRVYELPSQSLKSKLIAVAEPPDAPVVR